MDIIICDDELQYINQIEEICTEYFGQVKVHKYMSGKELLDNKSVLDNNILFLDIELGDADGIKIKDYLEYQDIRNYVVFVTGYAEFITQAFGRNVMGYVRKPINKVEIIDILDKISKLEQRYHESGEFEISNIDGEIKIVKPIDIKYIHSQHVYTQLIMSDGRNILTRKSLAEWESKLDGTFARVGRSYIVNMEYVKGIEEYSVCLDDDIKIKVGRGNIKQIKEMYFDCIRKKARRI